MGKKIDRFVLTVVVGAGFYLYFQNAFHMRPLSLFLALLSCLVLSKIMHSIGALAKKSRYFQRRRLRKCAAGTMMHLACLPYQDGLKRVENLVHLDYDGEYTVELIQAHPSCALSQQRLFEIWKSHQGEERLVICATCAADPASRLLSASFRAPQVALVDSPLLSQLLSDHPENLFPEKEVTLKPGYKYRFKRTFSRLLNRKNAPRCLLFSVSIFALYLLSGRIYYLIFSLLLLFLALASLRHIGRPAKLF